MLDNSSNIIVAVTKVILSAIFGTSSISISRIINNHKNSQRSILIFHEGVFKNFRNINQDIEDKYDILDIGESLLKWELLVFIIGIFGTVELIHIFTDHTDIPHPIAIIIANVATIMFIILILLVIRRKKNIRIKIVFINVIIPTILLSISIFSLINDNLSSYISTLLVFLAFLIESLLLFSISKTKLMINDTLLEENKIIASTYGLLFTLLISATIMISWLWVIIQKDMFYWYSAIAALGGLFIVAYIISDIKKTAIHLLWKAKVLEFSDSLPHLIVKTKTSNVFFGQIYDPLDDKFLILRKAKFVSHNGQEIWATLEKIVSNKVSFQGNYILIPWEEIETLQIVEDGLYKVMSTE